VNVDVIASNFKFLIVQGFFGFGNFAGGTIRLALPAIALGFALGIVVGLARLAPVWWIRVPATVYVEFFRGVPLVMVIFWMWFILPQVLGLALPEYGIALTDWDALPRAGAMIAAVAHAEYRGLGVDKIAAKLVQGGCFVDVKSAFDRDALGDADLRVWRL